MKINKSEENDEEALKGAVLEKLPTYDRLRKCLLTEIEGNFREVDVMKLGVQDKKDLIERLLKDGDVDNKDFLLNLRKRIDRAGIDIPTIEARFEKLCIEAQVYAGRRALPTIYNSFLNTIEGFLHCLEILPRSKTPLQILHNVSGIIKPGK